MERSRLGKVITFNTMQDAPRIAGVQVLEDHVDALVDVRIVAVARGVLDGVVNALMVDLVLHGEARAQTVGAGRVIRLTVR